MGGSDLWDMVKPAQGGSDLWDLVQPRAPAEPIPQEFAGMDPKVLASAFGRPPVNYQPNVASQGQVAAKVGTDLASIAGNFAGEAVNSIADIPSLPTKIAGAAAQYVGAKTGNKTLEQGATDLLRTTESMPRIPTDPENPGTVLGGGVGFMGAAALAPELLGLKGLAALTPAALAMGAQNGYALHQKVLEETHDPDKAMAALLGGGAGGAALGILPAARVLARINGASGGVLVRAIGDMGADVGAGFAYGAGQSALNDTIEQYATDKDLPILENALKIGGVTAAQAFILGQAVKVLSKPTDRGPAQEPRPLIGEAPKAPELIDPVRGDDTVPDAGLDRFKAANTPLSAEQSGMVRSNGEGDLTNPHLSETPPPVETPAPKAQPDPAVPGRDTALSREVPGAAPLDAEGVAPIAETKLPLKAVEPAPDELSTILNARRADLRKSRTPEEIDAYIAEQEQSQKEVEERLLGDRVREWRRATERDPDRAEAIEKDKGLSQAQVDSLYGIGDRRASVRDLQKVRDEISAMDIAADNPDPTHLVEEAARTLRKLGRSGNGPDEWIDREPAAYAGMRRLFEIVGERGIDPVRFSKDAIKKAASAFSDPADAEYMLAPFIKNMQEPPPRVELPAPKPKIPLRLAEPKPAEPAPKAKLPLREVEPEPVAETKPERLPVEATGIKNRTVDAELERMGLPPAKHGESRSDPEVYGKAKEAFDADPDAGRKLVDSLEKSQRPPTDDDVALLTFEANKRINERDAAEDAFRSNPSEENQARVDRSKADYAQFADIDAGSGTQSGRAFRLRRMMIARDYSLAAMERATDVASGGKADAERQAKVTSLHEQLAEVDRLIAERETRLASLEQTEALKREVRARKPKGAAAIEAYLAPKAEAALKRLTSKARSGIGGEDLADAAIIGAHLIAKGAAKVETFTAQMVELLGEGIREHLPTIYAQAREIHDGAPKEASKLKGQKTRALNEIAKIQHKIEAKDYSKTERKPPLEPDNELLDLRVRRDKLVREYKRDLFSYEQEHRTTGRKVLDAARETRGLLGNLMTSFDLSAVGRQGIFYTLSHPVQSARNVKLMVKAAASEGFNDKLAVAIRTRPNYEAGRRAGLEVTDVSDVLTPQEEMLRSRIANKIPGVAASNRAFTTYMNLQRVQAFDALYDGYPGQMTPKVAKEIAAKVNTATGRGSIKGWESVIKNASEVLFAPKLYISRFKLLAGEPMWSGDPYVRKAFAKDYARFIAAIGAIYALNALINDEPVETDPRSSDFGKIRIRSTTDVGDAGPVSTRIDITGGLNQYTVLLSQMTTGDRKALATGEIQEANRGDTLAKFLRSKLSPVIGSSVDVLQGKNVIGEEVTPLDAARRLVTPLQFQDIYEAMQEHGIAKGAALSMLGFFGAGVQTFEPRTPKKTHRLPYRISSR